MRSLLQWLTSIKQLCAVKLLEKQKKSEKFDGLLNGTLDKFNMELKKH